MKSIAIGDIVHYRPSSYSNLVIAIVIAQSSMGQWADIMFANGKIESVPPYRCFKAGDSNEIAKSNNSRL